MLAKLSGDLGNVRRLCEATGEACMADEVALEDARRAVGAMIRNASAIVIKLEGIEMALAGVN